jgi:hypothetical protein
LPYRAFLDRIRRLFEGPSEHFDLIADSFAKGRLKQPIKPMSDQELAVAIREFRNLPPTPTAIEKLETHLSVDGQAPET